MAIAFRASSTTEGTDTSVEIDIPSGSTQDDILVAAIDVTSQDNPGTTLTWPGGWTVLNEDNVDTTTSGRLSVAWKKFNTGDGTQTATVSATLTSGGWVTACAAYSGVSPTTPVLSNSMTDMLSTSGSEERVTGSATNSKVGVWKVVAFGAHKSSADTTWTMTDTERVDNACTAPTRRAHIALADSNGTVDASAGVTGSATPASAVANRAEWIGLLNPAVAAGDVAATATTNKPNPAVKAAAQAVG